jgi:hypothetical protein
MLMTGSASFPEKKTETGQAMSLFAKVQIKR